MALCERRSTNHCYAEYFHPRQLAKAGVRLNRYKIVVLKEHVLYHCLTLPKASPLDYSHYPLQNNLKKKKHAHEPETSSHMSKGQHKKHAVAPWNKVLYAHFWPSRTFFSHCVLNQQNPPNICKMTAVTKCGLQLTIYCKRNLLHKTPFLPFILLNCRSLYIFSPVCDVWWNCLSIDPFCEKQKSSIL